MKKTLLTLLVTAGLCAAAHAQVLLSVDFNSQFYNQTEPGFTGLAYTTTYPVAVGIYTVNLTSNQNVGTGNSPTNPVSDAQLWKDFAVTDNFGTFTLTISGLTAGESYVFDAWSWRDGLGSTQNVLYTPVNGTGGVADTATYLSAAPTSLSDYSVNMALTANGSGEVSVTISAGTYNGTVINGFQLSAVPEPATTALFAIGAAGMLGMVRRRRLV
jgi:hypothetical protein